MQLQSGDCYLLGSEQIVKLRNRLDERRWVAVIWNHTAYDWSRSVYAIDELLINGVVCDPESR